VAPIIQTFHPLDPVKHALVAVGELLEAVYWTRTNGQQSVAAAALVARQCLLGLDPSTVDDQWARAILYKLRDAVAQATQGSVFKWKVEAIEPIVESLRIWAKSPPTIEDGEENETGASQASPDGTECQLPARFERAYRSFKFAELHLGRVPTDIEAYKWLEEEGPEDYSLPDLETWKRYLRKGREHYGEQKNSPRAGRTGRSVLTSNDLDIPSDR